VSIHLVFEADKSAQDLRIETGLKAGPHASTHSGSNLTHAIQDHIIVAWEGSQDIEAQLRVDLLEGVPSRSQEQDKQARENRS